MPYKRISSFQNNNNAYIIFSTATIKKSQGCTHTKLMFGLIARSDNSEHNENNDEMMLMIKMIFNDNFRLDVLLLILLQFK